MTPQEILVELRAIRAGIDDLITKIINAAATQKSADVFRL